MTAARRRTCILVLGMHRSGTSALTRVISLMGAALPKALMAPGPSNVTGHWEPASLVQLHERMLAEAGSSWDDWCPLDLTRQLSAARLDSYKIEIERQIREDYGDADVFVLKDPRICRFVPLYRDLLESEGVDLKPVLTLRHPAAVAKSLEARDGMGPHWARLCWLRHVLDAEAATRDLPRLIISYETLLAERQTAIRRLSDVLCVEPRDEDQDLASHIDLFLSHQHNHHLPPVHCRSEDWAEEVWRLFDPIGDGPTSLEALERVASLFEKATEAFGPVVARDREALAFARSAAAQERIALEAEVRDWQDRTAAMETQLTSERTVHGIAMADARTSFDAALNAERAQHRAALGALRSEHDAALAQSEARAAAADQARVELKSELDAEISRLNQRVIAAESREAALHRTFAGVIGSPAMPLALASDQGKQPPTPLGWLARLRLRLQGLSVIALPISQLSRSLVAEAETTWSASGNDPQFLIDFKHASLPAGHYEFRCRRAPSGPINPSVYVDTGHGFAETAKAPCSFVRTHLGSWVARFSLPQGAKRLRLDPCEEAGSFTLPPIRLRRRSRLEHYAGLSLALLRTRLRSPSDVIGISRRIWRSISRGGVHALAADLRSSASRVHVEKMNYSAWIRQYDTLTDGDRETMGRRVRQFNRKPLISIVMPTYNTPVRFLREAIDSVLKQTYPYWELCIADDASSNSEVRDLLAAYAKSDSRIKVIYRKSNGHIAEASNTALQLATGEWIALLDHDDVLAEHALYCVAEAINANPGARLIYSDEDTIDLHGVRHDPYFKSDWNPMLFLSHNLITHLGVYHGPTMREIGGFGSGVDGAQDYDLALRFIERVSPDAIVHIPHVLYHWRVLPGSTAMSGDEKPYAMLAGERALDAHFERTGCAAKANLIGFGYRIDFDLPDPAPFVSIIIPTRNAHVLTRQCIESVRARTTYKNYEIILVDNGSDDPQALAYFGSLADKQHALVIRDDRPFNYSALNNAAVERAAGSVVALVNNDIEVITPDWLTRMVSLAVQPGIGAVGAKLLYPNGTFQHGGVVLGLGGLAAHAHADFPRYSAGYVGRAALAQNFSAVTGACLVVQKSLYLSVGGLNERDLAVAYNDVDFCLRLQRLGLRNVWTPFAELYHHESATRGYETTPEKRARFEKEKAYMVAAWPDEISNDPAYNPNLTVSKADFSLAFPPRKPLPWRLPDSGVARHQMTASTAAPAAVDVGQRPAAE